MLYAIAMGQIISKYCCLLSDTTVSTSDARTVKTMDRSGCLMLNALVVRDITCSADIQDYDCRNAVTLKTSRYRVFITPQPRTQVGH